MGSEVTSSSFNVFHSMAAHLPEAHNTTSQVPGLGEKRRDATGSIPDEHTHKLSNEVNERHAARLRIE